MRNSISLTLIFRIVMSILHHYLQIYYLLPLKYNKYSYRVGLISDKNTQVDKY